MSDYRYVGLSIGTPMNIRVGWMEEDDVFWPMVSAFDIFSYLMFFPSELGSTDLSGYKQCKAYSYFSNRWLQPLLYHNLSGTAFCKR